MVGGLTEFIASMDTVTGVITITASYGFVATLRGVHEMAGSGWLPYGGPIDLGGRVIFEVRRG